MKPSDSEADICVHARVRYPPYKAPPLSRGYGGCLDHHRNTESVPLCSGKSRTWIGFGP